MKSAYIGVSHFTLRNPRCFDRIFASLKISVTSYDPYGPPCAPIAKVLRKSPDLCALTRASEAGKPYGPDRETDAATLAIRFETILCA